MSAGFKARTAVVVDAGSGKAVAWPLGHHAGDFAILLGQQWDTVTTVAEATPAGWTLIGSVQSNNGGVVFARQTAWYAIATSGAMATPTIATSGVGHASAGVMYTFSGALNAAPDATAVPAITTNAISIAGVTTTSPNDLIINCVFRLSNSGTPESVSGWANANLANVVEYADTGTAIGGNTFGIGMACGMMRSAGATGATTATWATADSYPDGCALTVALKPKATVAVTQDATSTKWWGSTEDEWATLFHGDGFATPLFDWNCQDATGASIVDAIGGSGGYPGSVGGTPLFQQAVASWSRKAIVCRGGQQDLINSAGFTDASNLAVAWLNYPTVNAIATPQNAMTFGNAFGSQVAVSTQASITKIDVTTSGDTHTNGTTPAAGNGASTQGVHLTFLQGDKDAALGLVQDDLESLSHATTAANNWGAFALGGNNIQYYTSAGVGCMGVAVFPSFPTTSTIRATITDRLNNGPAVVSIAVTPTSYTIAPVATQQMVATATRADGSTYNAAATATWLSSSPSVATVSATGLVTGVAAGTTNITASFTSLNAATATSPAQVVTVSGGGPTPPQNTPGVISSIVIGVPGIGFVR